MRACKFARRTIWFWKQDPPEAGQPAGVIAAGRPVLIISNDGFNDFSPVVNVLPISSSYNKASPVHVPIRLKRPSHVECEQIMTVPKSELRGYIALAPDCVYEQVCAMLAKQLVLGGWCTDEELKLKGYNSNN